MVHILSGVALYGVTSREDYWAWLVGRESVKGAAQAMGVDLATLPMPSELAAGEPVHAYVNHGRWVVDCPDEHCGGASAAAPEWPFMCPACLNVKVSSLWREVAWPAELESIVMLLEQRDFPTQANWTVGEPVDQLLVENVEAFTAGAAARANGGDVE